MSGEIKCNQAIPLDIGLNVRFGVQSRTWISTRRKSSSAACQVKHDYGS